MGPQRNSADRQATERELELCVTHTWQRSMMKKLPYFGCLLALSTWCQGLPSQSLLAQEIVRIEEDWELRVTQPDLELDAPQVTMMMFPVGDQTDLILQVDLNYGSWPNFTRGGFQVRAFDGEDTLSEVRQLEGELLSQNAEVIRWTQVAQKAGKGFYFGVTRGSGESWGSFGGDGSFIYVSYADAGGSQFENYGTQPSLQNSGVTYASNRVESLVLKKLRLYRVQRKCLGMDAQYDCSVILLPIT